MSWIMGPAGLVSLGAAIFVGFLWLRFRTARDARSDDRACSGGQTRFNGYPRSEREWSQMTERLEEEKRQVTRLLAEAQRTTASLERMIDSFDRTFYRGEGANGSVASIFDGLTDRMKSECRTMAERTRGRRKAAETLTKTVS